MSKISIARDFSPYPGGRKPSDGPKSGEAFRNNLLLPALKRAEQQGDSVTVSLDGVKSSGPTFWEEVFGGLVRDCGYSPARLRELMRVVADNPIHNPFYLDLIWRYVDRAGAEKTAVAENSR